LVLQREPKTRTRARHTGQEICTVAKRKPLVLPSLHEAHGKNRRGRITLIGGKNMTKHEAAWLVIRTLGLLALAGALMYASSLLYIVYLFGSGALKDLSQDIGRQMDFYTTLPRAIACVVFLAVGIYLLKGGSKLHAVIMREK
jgi:hypothetical protein